MSQIAKSSIRFAILTAALAVVPVLNAQQPAQPAAAPIPAQIISAHKVFISNAGADAAAQDIFKRAGDPEEAYNCFYSSMQSWGKYELVSAPADADMVLEIRFAAQTSMNGSVPIYSPEFELTLLDAKTHFILWKMAQPVNGAFRKETWLKNFNEGLHALLDNLKKLTTPSIPADLPKK